MDFEFVFVSIANTFIIMSAMTNSLLFPIRKTNKFVVCIYILLCQVILGPSFGQSIIVFTIIGSLIIIQLSYRQSLSNIVFALIGYLIAVLMNYIIFVPLSLLGISVENLNSGYFSVFTLLVYGTLTYGVTRLLGKYLRHKILPIIHIFSPKIRLLIALELLACFIIFAVNIVQEEKAGYPTQIIYFNIILFTAFFIVTLVIFFFCLRILMKNHELMQLQKEKKNLTEYMSRLEDMYDNMRIFKHDYINVLSTLQCYIMDTDSDDLKNYFQTTIMPNAEKLTDKDMTMGRLSNIKVIEIKGIIYSKLILAMNLGLAVTLEIKDEITSLSMEMLDLSKIIGIFMDNAIEAAKDTAEKKLVVAIINNTTSVTIIISNSSAEVNGPLNSLYKKNTSSKQGHNGLGLYSVAQILAAYSNIIHTTNYKGSIFTQTLEVCHTEE